MSPFLDSSAIGFSLANARACALASRAAYGAATITDPRTDTQVNITADANGNIIIAFRGTNNLRDWLTDFEAWRGTIDGCEIHFGFLCAIRNVMPQVMDELRKIIGIKNIFITGHSLGGALAMLCAAEFALEESAIRNPPGSTELAEVSAILRGVYTFGQPRVGNATFRNRYNAALLSPERGLQSASTSANTFTADISSQRTKIRAPSENSTLGSRTFRIVHEEDIVPRVPFLLFGYRHAGQLALLDSFGGLQINPPLWKLLLSDVWGEWRAYNEKNLLAALEPLNDHGIDNYVKRLV